MAEPQVWSTAVMPILAPRCLGSASDSERGVGGRFEQEILDHGLVLVGNVGDRPVSVAGKRNF